MASSSSFLSGKSDPISNLINKINGLKNLLICIKDDNLALAKKNHGGFLGIIGDIEKLLNDAITSLKECTSQQHLISSAIYRTLYCIRESIDSIRAPAGVDIPWEVAPGFNIPAKKLPFGFPLPQPEDDSNKNVRTRIKSAHYRLLWDLLEDALRKAYEIETTFRSLVKEIPQLTSTSSIFRTMTPATESKPSPAAANHLGSTLSRQPTIPLITMSTNHLQPANSFLYTSGPAQEAAPPSQTSTVILNTPGSFTP
jgi:hypothetical protein